LHPKSETFFSTLKLILSYSVGDTEVTDTVQCFGWFINFQVFMRKFTCPKVIILTHTGNKTLIVVNYFNLIVNAKLLTPVIS